MRPAIPPFTLPALLIATAGPATAHVLNGAPESRDLVEPSVSVGSRSLAGEPLPHLLQLDVRSSCREYFLAPAPIPHVNAARPRRLARKADFRECELTHLRRRC